MDLTGFLGSAHRALTFVKGSLGSDPPWATNEREFERHFGEPYELFVMIVEHLSNEQRELLDATVAVNPEAAILWILAMDVVE